MSTQHIQPYRVLFPIGLTLGLFGAGVWPLHVLGAIPYPGVQHRLLMIQGFEQSFVLGFLLTAMPGFTKGEPCRPIELWLAALLAVSMGIAAVLGQTLAANLQFATSLVLMMVVLARRLGPSPSPRPPELVFVGFGLLLGLCGALIQIVRGGIDVFGGRLISLGMVLSLVLGLGGLLVPTFTGMRDPLAIPGVASVHEPRRRLAFYVTMIGLLALAFVAEAIDQAWLGALLRAIPATAMILLVWKLARLPG